MSVQLYNVYGQRLADTDPISEAWYVEYVDYEARQREVDRLTAELAELRSDLASARATMLAINEQRDTYSAELAACHAENERLQASRQEWRSRMGLKVTDDIVVENEKLRELLRYIRPQFTGGSLIYSRIDAALKK
jgi:hypothetical protein